MLKKTCTEELQKEIPTKSDYFTAIGSSSVKKVTDRNRHAARHNKQWRAS